MNSRHLAASWIQKDMVSKSGAENIGQIPEH